jgi:hypothetical protein
MIAVLLSLLYWYFFIGLLIAALGLVWIGVRIRRYHLATHEASKNKIVEWITVATLAWPLVIVILVFRD